ncbi:hypothetical protein C1646_759974 [Rhizophagus diaphanus]|nr:hypothetical protein C1646_759974 [Rhizophagus diaphanus] [Rhizophagus sp. MUCL 43196]
MYKEEEEVVAFDQAVHQLVNKSGANIFILIPPCYPNNNQEMENNGANQDTKTSGKRMTMKIRITVTKYGKDAQTNDVFINFQEILGNIVKSHDLNDVDMLMYGSPASINNDSSDSDTSSKNNKGKSSGGETDESIEDVESNKVIEEPYNQKSYDQQLINEVIQPNLDKCNNNNTTTTTNENNILPTPDNSMNLEEISKILEKKS